MIDTVALACLDTPTVDPEFYQISYYDSSYVTGSGATYRKVSSPPSHLGKFQNGNGTWYAISTLPRRPQMFGAKADGITNDRPACQAAVDSLNVRGGTVDFSGGVFKVSPASQNLGCIWVPYDNISFVGDGVIETTNNADVPIHVSPINDLTVNVTAAEVNGFTCRGITVRGTDQYQYFALAYGRGILLRYVKNAIISGVRVHGMSMIGICSEHGNGNFLVEGNIVERCKFTGINYNGRCYQSIISNNIISGTDGTPNSSAIEADGHCIITGNTVFGSNANYSNCGGILWGEGNYDGLGIISGNLIKNCKYGVKAMYHGAVSIHDNTIINCRTEGGIITVGGTLEGLSLANSDNVISGNMLVNNYPQHILSGSNNTLISGNKCRVIATPLNASGPSQPDTIQVVSPDYGIVIAANNNSVVNNIINGGVRGISLLEGKTLAVVQGNDMYGVSSGNFVVTSANGKIVATHDLFERKANGRGEYRSTTFSAVKPTQGFWRIGDTWERMPGGVGIPLGETVITTADTVSTGYSGPGSSSVSVATAPSGATGNLIGIQLDDGSYHWTSVAITGSVITLASPIPSGRSVQSGAIVRGQQWRSLSMLA